MLSIFPSKLVDPSKPSAPAPAPVVDGSTAVGGIERRAATRYPASLVPSITGLRMSPHGADAVLVNISETGLLAECTERLQTGSQVTVNFEGDFTRGSIGGQVVRVLVAAMANDGRLRYHIGIAFDSRIVLEGLPMPSAKPAAAAPAPAEPAVRNRW